IAGVERVLAAEETIDSYTSVIGLNFIDNYSQANGAFVIVSLKPFHDRLATERQGPAVIARLNDKLREVRGGTAVAVAPPPIIGLGTAGGLSHLLEDQNRPEPQALAQVLRGMLVAANQNPSLTRVFSTFSASTPSVFLDIDRDKVQVLGIKLSDVFQALQTSLGGYYVNDINLFGRTWQVNVQAEAQDRASVDDIYRIN